MKTLDCCTYEELTLSVESQTVKDMIKSGVTKEDFYLAMLRPYLGDTELDALEEFSDKYDRYKSNKIVFTVINGELVPLVNNI